MSSGPGAFPSILCSRYGVWAQACPQHPEHDAWLGSAHARSLDELAEAEEDEEGENGEEGDGEAEEEEEEGKKHKKIVGEPHLSHNLSQCPIVNESMAATKCEKDNWPRYAKSQLSMCASLAATCCTLPSVWSAATKLGQWFCSRAKLPGAG